MQVKLYFMIGLPGETDADVMGIAETIEFLQRECQSGEAVRTGGLRPPPPPPPRFAAGARALLSRGSV